MLGNLGFSVPIHVLERPAPEDDAISSIFMSGGKMHKEHQGVPFAPQNQTISAILVLGRVPVGNRLFHADLQEREVRQGREFALEEHLRELEASQVQLGTRGGSHYESSFTKTPMLASCCQPNSSVDHMTSATGVATEEFSGYFKATRSPGCRRPWTEAYVGQEPLASQPSSPRLVRELLGSRYWIARVGSLRLSARPLPLRLGKGPGAASARQVASTLVEQQRQSGAACHDLDQRIRSALEKRQHHDRRLEHTYEGYQRALSMIHPETERKRKDGDRPDRVEGRIESLIEGRMRSRWHGLDR